MEKFKNIFYLSCMKGKKRKVKPISGSVKIDPAILQKARDYCNIKGLKLYSYVTLALDNQLNGDLQAIENEE